MPKTKDAFALEGFDETRILSRNYFRGYAPPTLTRLTTSAIAFAKSIPPRPIRL